MWRKAEQGHTFLEDPSLSNMFYMHCSLMPLSWKLRSRFPDTQLSQVNIKQKRPFGRLYSIILWFVHAFGYLEEPPFKNLQHSVHGQDLAPLTWLNLAPLTWPNQAPLTWPNLAPLTWPNQVTKHKLRHSSGSAQQSAENYSNAPETS